MKSLRNILLAALAFALLPAAALAQAPTLAIKGPQFVANQAWLDLGNGPMYVAAAQGNGSVYSSQGSGTGSTSGSSTTLTLTATAAADPPCVGCVIAGAGITQGTTVAAFNGTTGITLSAAMTVAASTALTWGVACPTSGAAGANQSPPAELRAGGIPGAIFPMNTSARVCAYGSGQGGMTVGTVPINAH